MAATTVDEEITLAPDDDDDDIVVSPVTVVTTVVPSTEPCGAPPQLGKLDSKSSTQFRFSLPLSISYSHYYISLSISFFSGVQPSATYIIVLSNFQLQQDTNPMLSWTPCP